MHLYLRIVAVWDHLIAVRPLQSSFDFENVSIVDPILWAIGPMMSSVSGRDAISQCVAPASSSLSVAHSDPDGPNLDDAILIDNDVEEGMGFRGDLTAPMETT